VRAFVFRLSRQQPSPFPAPTSAILSLVAYVITETQRRLIEIIRREHNAARPVADSPEEESLVLRRLEDYCNLLLNRPYHRDTVINTESSTVEDMRGEISEETE
jgi:hypothetical protein